MSFDKSYPNRKDWRRPYRQSKRFDHTCRNHGSCPWCRANRLHRHRRGDTLWTEIQEFKHNSDQSLLLGKGPWFHVDGGWYSKDAVGEIVPMKA